MTRNPITICAIPLPPMNEISFLFFYFSIHPCKENKISVFNKIDFPLPKIAFTIMKKELPAMGELDELFCFFS
jgi:hypothetical protein